MITKQCSLKEGRNSSADKTADVDNKLYFEKHCYIDRKLWSQACILAYLTARTSVVSSAQIPSITRTTSDVSLLLQGVAALCLEMALQVQCGI